jgi:hypothetical protein
MKKLFGILLVLLTSALANAQLQTQNIIVITTDGFRWQDVFTGMDSSLANDNKYNQDDSEYIFKHYWSPDLEDRRKLLLPFIWSKIASEGQLFGNRNAGCKVNNANHYWYSYPGYNEILTGYPDTAIKNNSFADNPNTNVLAFLNRQNKLKGKVAAFGAWYAFDKIINEKRSGIPVFSAFDNVGGKLPNANERLINTMNHDAYRPFGEDECLDVFTHYSAMEYLKNKKPRVLYIAYGETDEWAHAGQYRSYLDAAHQFDAWLKQIWDLIQKDPQYKNKTTLFIATDHGRGTATKEDWRHHNQDYPGSSEIWFGVLGPDSPARGEIKDDVQLYQEQFAQTIAKLMGFTFTAEHPIGKEIHYVFKMRK